MLVWWGGYWTYEDLNAGSIRDKLLDLCGGLFESRLGDVGHEDGSALLGEENGGLKTNATAIVSIVSCTTARQRNIPSSASDDGVLSSETAHCEYVK